MERAQRTKRDAKREVRRLSFEQLRLGRNGTRQKQTRVSFARSRISHSACARSLVRRSAVAAFVASALVAAPFSLYSGLNGSYMGIVCAIHTTRGGTVSQCQKDTDEIRVTEPKNTASRLNLSFNGATRNEHALHRSSALSIFRSLYLLDTRARYRALDALSAGIYRSLESREENDYVLCICINRADAFPIIIRKNVMVKVTDKY